jgi:hypothetical protein
MFAKIFLAAVGGVALVSAQDYPPTTVPVSTLSTTMSGVLPYLPTSTGFTGVETIEGAITYDGPIVEGFTGSLSPIHECLGGIPYSDLLYFA